MLKIVTIVGARPQFIKAATVSRVVRQREDIEEVLVHTGQHYDHGMSNVFFRELEISELNYNLGVGSGSHGFQTGRMLEAIEYVLLKEKPNWVLVYGDTNSTLAGSLAAAKLHIPVAHVEAGLRSNNRSMPEELNRILTDHACDLLFAPTETALKNLVQEGIAGNRVHKVGDVMYDAVLYYSAKAERTSRILEASNITAKSYVLATVHRAENTNDPKRLRRIFDGLARVAKEIRVILPLHPRTHEALKREALLESTGQHMKLIEPLGYLDMIMLEKNALVIATDSGGVQKEAYFYQVPCVTLRDETEWVELVESGFNTLSGADSDRISETVLNSAACEPNWSVNLYGDGKAARKVVEAMLLARSSIRLNFHSRAPDHLK